MKYRYYRLASKSDFHALYTIHDHGGGGGGGRIIIPSFSPARILLGSSFILRAQRFPREQVEGQVEDPSIDRSIIRLSRTRLLSHQSKDGPREAELVHTIVTTTLADAT